MHYEVFICQKGSKALMKKLIIICLTLALALAMSGCEELLGAGVRASNRYREQNEMQYQLDNDQRPPAVGNTTRGEGEIIAGSRPDGGARPPNHMRDLHAPTSANSQMASMSLGEGAEITGLSQQLVRLEEETAITDRALREVVGCFDEASQIMRPNTDLGRGSRDFSINLGNTGNEIN